MTIEINEKIIKHEWRLNQHDESIKKMETKQEHLVRTLDSLLSQTKTIKVVAVTVGIMIAAGEIGIIAIIRGFI